MILEINIKLTTNFLGSGPRVNGVRKLKKTPDNRITINEKEWKEDLSSSAKSLEIDFCTENMNFEPGFEFPEVNVLRRIYNKTNVDLFEGITAGNHLSIFCMVENYTEDKLEDIKKVFEIFGKFYGISQFGKKFHCGRFKLISINRLTKSDYKI